MSDTHTTCAGPSFAACPVVPSLGRMADSRIALVTGATQGLGRALVAGLAARLRPDNHVLLTGRNPETVAAETIAAETIAAGRLARSRAPVPGPGLGVADPRLV